MRSVLLFFALAGSVASAETAGPQRPAAAKTSPADAAIANYRQSYDAAEPLKPCQRAKTGEVVVCGQSDRLPLPGERGAPAVRTATGEAPHMGVGGAPFHHEVAGTGLTLTVKPGKTTLKGNGAR